MGGRKAIVITVFGHNKTVDKISVGSFEIPENTGYNHQKSNAENYCDAVNSLELKEDAWIFAKILSENTQYDLNVFIPLKFQDIIVKLDDRAIQKILREIDSQDLAVSLKNQDKTVQEKIFRNMSKRAAQMLQEDMEYTGPVRLMDIKERQEKILDIIRRLDQSGEINLSYYNGETVE
jgi:flagellar motor switch protein FliG